MSEKYIVSLDIGTSSVRAFAVSLQGKIVAQQSVPFAPTRNEGTSEYDGKSFLKTTTEVLDGLLAQSNLEDVLAIAIACQRSTVVLWDKGSGEVVAPILTWEDGRATKQTSECPLSQEKIHDLTGLYNIPYFSAPKIRWCLQNIPVVKETLNRGNLCVAPLASYFIWHLTKGKIYATDATLAQRMLLLDIHSHKWSQQMCQAFEVPMSVLPTILPSASEYGHYQFNGKNIPILACVGDQQAAALLTAEEKGQAHINYGTGAFYLQNVGNDLALLSGMFSSVAANSLDDEKNYLLEGNINVASSFLLWLTNQGIAVPPVEKIKTSSLAPLWILPAFGGLGSPYFDTQIKPVVIGLTPRTSSEDWVCGIFRAIAFLIKDITNYAYQCRIPLAQDVFISGGLSKSPYLLQFQADLLGKTLNVLPEIEATALGSAKLVAKKLGISFDYVAKTVLVTPTKNLATTHKDYLRWQEFVAWAKKNPL